MSLRKKYKSLKRKYAKMEDEMLRIDSQAGQLYCQNKRLEKLNEILTDLYLK